MPIIVPPFVQYQSPIVPLRGLWNSTPVEGDRFVNVEVQWGVTTGPGMAVQFALSGNSPVAMSQIVALSVDNSRSGSDVQFLFPDSGFVLQIPAYNQGVYPCFTNALMFYAVADNGGIGDVTSFQILNSMPPPVAIQPASTQAHAGVGEVNFAVNGSTPIVPASVSGTIESGMAIVSLAAGGSGGIADLAMVDGIGNVLWLSIITAPADSVQTYSIPLAGLRLRFVNGINLVVTNSQGFSGASLSVNLYYSQP